MKLSLNPLQALGRALMLPIAVLPVAGILLRLGQPDVAGLLHLDLSFIGAAGQAIFDNLGLLFAIGVAVGFAREGHGAAALAGAVCFLVASKGAESLVAVPASELAGAPDSLKPVASAAFKAKSIAELSVPIGILSGIIAGQLYNRYGAIKLPEYLAFFGGRRFVPIAAGLAGLVLAAVFGYGWPTLEQAIKGLSYGIARSGEFGLFAYGVLNRVLIVTGLHHILNSVVWFILGDYKGATGDMHRFFAGDPTAGAFMAGFFPVMMFGLPAACLAMYHAAAPDRRKAVGGMLFSMALTAFLTGVTEPIEFSFMFLAPLLYALHAVLTGASMVIMDVLKVRLGFGFSAGLFDYVLNFDKATRPLWLLPVGAVYALVYYGTFRWAIVRFDLKTPGREPAGEAPVTRAVGGSGEAGDFIAALGGAQNLESVEACTTRLRLVVRDQSAVNEAALRALGARGLVRPSPTALQVVLGPQADQVASEIRAALPALSGRPGPSAAAPGPPREVAISDEEARTAEALVAAVGGPENLLEVQTCSTRLRLRLRDDTRADAAALDRLPTRGVVRPGAGVLHLLIGPSADRVGRAVEALLRPSPQGTRLEKVT